MVCLKKCTKKASIDRHLSLFGCYIQWKHSFFVVFFLLISQWNQNMVANSCNSFLLLLWDRKPVFAAPTLASSQMVCGDQMQASKTWWHTCLDTIFHYFKGREWRGQAVRACVKCAFQAAATIADCSGPLGLRDYSPHSQFLFMPGVSYSITGWKIHTPIHLDACSLLAPGGFINSEG